MKKKHLSSRIAVFVIGILTAFIIITIGTLISHFFSRELRLDFDRFTSEEYDSVFLSMYPLDTYKEEDFTIWRGQDTIVTTHEIPNAFILKHYLEKIAVSNPNVNMIYLGIRPDRISGEKVAKLLSAYTSIPSGWCSPTRP